MRGLFLRQPDLDLLRVQDVGLRQVGDREILSWAASNQCIILTHDRATMPDFAYERLLNGDSMAGLFVIHDRMPTRQAIDELFLIVQCSKQEEWNGIVLYLPL